MATRTVDQIIAELNELYEGEGGGDKVIEALSNSSVAVIKKVRSKSFAAGKKEGGKDSGEKDTKLEEVQTKLDAATTELDELKKKAPTVEAETKKLTDKHTAEIAKRDARIAELEGNVITMGREAHVNKFIDLITGEEFGVDKEYATEVLRTKMADRFVTDKKTGKVTDILKPGETTGYEAESLDEKMKLLAKDVKSTIKSPKFLSSNGDSGAGIRGSNDGGGVKGGTTLTTEQLTERKNSSGIGYGTF